MKLDVFSHCAIDTIYINDTNYVVPGGAACYCSLMANALKFDVSLHTKFGSDFSLVDYLSKNKIIIKNGLSEKETTKFTLKILSSDRTIFLENQCGDINYVGLDSGNVLISPIFSEISDKVFEKIKKDSNFIFLDPQGFLRRKDTKNKIYLEKTDMNLSSVSAIKISPDELECFTNNRDADGMCYLQKKGIENVILTNKQNISLLSKDKIYTILLPDLELFDTTGVGDIFSATFCCTMIKENDILWALSFAGGAAQAALESKRIGLEKIPRKGAVETNAYYFYNTIKFKQI
tara:strand:+ start:646 stop:1518 length:873 start_codon:yes stop_codon:yes gene_type:complete